jgi:hypothetical protein
MLQLTKDAHSPSIAGSRKRLVIALLVLAFLFRLGFGLCSEFWLEDEKQTFLIGLKFFATHAWPYFGPDVDYPQVIQQPGALEGLMVGLPLFLLHLPEAPFILLNILSFLCLCLFAWYCSKRLPQMPGWYIWIWLFIAPWTLQYSTHIVNLSYLLSGSILFFVGFLEACPPLRKDVLPLRWAYFMMGFGFFWVIQFHMSWVLLLPYVVVSCYCQYRRSVKAFLSSCGWFALGALLPGCLLVPTFWRYGWRGGMGGTDSTIHLNVRNLLNIYNLPEGIIGRFLSFASFELARFLGSHTAERLAFFREQPWLIPFGVLLLVIGILQPVAMLVLWFSKQQAQKDWGAIKYLMLASIALLYFSFLLAKDKPPSSHTYYVMLPIAMLYSFYCWNIMIRRRGWLTFAKVFLACAAIFQLGVAINNFSRKSLFVDRAVPQAAIDKKDYRILGERRDGARY